MQRALLTFILSVGAAAYGSAWSDLGNLLHEENPESTIARPDIQARYMARYRLEHNKTKTWPDADVDGTIDVFDNCPLVYNPKQSDVDGDKMGDSFNGEQGCDEVCALTYPPHHYCNARTVETLVWWDGGENFSYYQACNAETPQSPNDFCETEKLTPEKYDDDGDRIPNVRDVCLNDIDPDQHDTDRDNIGDACDVEDPCGPRNLPCAPDAITETTNGLALQTVTD